MISSGSLLSFLVCSIFENQAMKGEPRCQPGSHPVVGQSIWSAFCELHPARSPRPNDKWHLDEVVVPIGGKKHWLWRGIDANGDALDILVQTRRNGKAAKRFFRKLITQFGAPRVVITDKLRSYIKPTKTLAPDADHRAHKGLNNAIEGSHRPTRKREKIFGRFKSCRQAQSFLTAHDPINLIFRPRRYRHTATLYRHARTNAFNLWADYTAEMVA
tara:strand:+ start:146 stop:793 length:648 start_codon:yes stop_codon:yes gene_type:complete